MVDFLGVKLVVGQEVVYLQHSSTSSELRRGTVKKLTPHFVYMTNDTRKSYNKVVVIHNAT